MTKRIVYLKETKNGSPLVVSLTQKVHELLSDKMKIRYLTHDRVFTSPTGRPIDPHNLRSDFRKVLKLAGIQDFRIHDPRHTYATRLAQSGVDVFTIANLIGHKDIRMTQRYAHHSTESLRRGVEHFETKISPILEQSGVVAGGCVL